MQIGSVALDLVALLLLTLVGAWMMRTERRVSRLEGGVLVAFYAAFLGALALGSVG